MFTRFAATTIALAITFSLGCDGQELDTEAEVTETETGEEEDYSDNVCCWCNGYRVWGPDDTVKDGDYRCKRGTGPEVCADLPSNAPYLIDLGIYEVPYAWFESCPDLMSCPVPEDVCIPEDFETN